MMKYIGRGAKKRKRLAMGNVSSAASAFLRRGYFSELVCDHIQSSMSSVTFLMMILCSEM
jgi:hypothetical protein